MYPYGNYQIPPVQLDYNPHAQQEPYDYDPIRQQLTQLLHLPQWRQLERRVTQLERQNERQEREIDQLQRRLQRLDQRVDRLENRNHVPLTPFNGQY